jgi:hypothetical protein
MVRPGFRLGLAAAACALAAAAPATAAVEGPCTASFNGIEAGGVGSLSSPLLLDAHDTLRFAGTDAAATRRAEVSLLLGPVTLGRAVSSQPAAVPEFQASLDLSTVASDAVGLLRIQASTDHCRVEAWLRVGGRLPFSTTAGLIGTGLAVAGVAWLAAALIARRGWSPWVAGASGLLTGAGAALLAQQSGRLQISYWSLAACAGVAAAVGAGLALLLRSRTVPTEEQSARAEPTDQAAAVLPSPAESLPASEPAAGPDLPEAPPPEESFPCWCYVLAEARVLHLDDHSRVVTTLRPGTWYLAKREIGGWAQVEAAPGIEGWVARRALHREG